eukprot:scaffold246708_cov28-Tisochrysis_lutea.AAC.4
MRGARTSIEPQKEQRGHIAGVMEPRRWQHAPRRSGRGRGRAQPPARRCSFTTTTRRPMQWCWV